MLSIIDLFFWLNGNVGNGSNENRTLVIARDDERRVDCTNPNLTSIIDVIGYQHDLRLLQSFN